MLFYLIVERIERLQRRNTESFHQQYLYVMQIQALKVMMISSNYASLFRFKMRTEKEEIFLCNLSSEKLLSLVEKGVDAVFTNRRGTLPCW